MKRNKTKKGIFLESELSKYMILQRITSKEALRMHTTIGSSTTMLKYFADPERIPLGNIKEIFSALKVPQEEQIKIVSTLIEKISFERTDSMSKLRKYIDIGDVEDFIEQTYHELIFDADKYRNYCKY